MAHDQVADAIPTAETLPRPRPKPTPLAFRGQTGSPEAAAYERVDRRVGWDHWVDA